MPELDNLPACQAVSLYSFKKPLYTGMKVQSEGTKLSILVTKSARPILSLNH